MPDLPIIWLGILCIISPVTVIMPLALIVFPYIRRRNYLHAKEHVSEGADIVALEIIQPGRRGRCALPDRSVSFRALNDSRQPLQRGDSATVIGSIDYPPDEMGFVVTHV